MLRELLVLALTCFCLSHALGVKIHTTDIEMLQKQKKIYELFLFIQQPSIEGSDMSKIGYSYDIEDNIDMYSNKTYVQDFLYRFKHGMLKRGVPFTSYHEKHREELLSLFHLFYTAKDFDTFYKTACFARIYMNEGLFVEALTTAVLFRPDCKDLQTPSHSEIFPYLYFDHDVIQKAQQIKMTMGHKRTGSMDQPETFVIESNNTRMCHRRQSSDEECKLDYFLEDIGINQFYYHCRIAYPFWLKMADLDVGYKKLRGEFYYTLHQQVMARYYLERLAQSLGPIEDFAFTGEFVPSFYSNLVYPNGVSVPKGNYMSQIPFYKYKYVREIENLEMRILAAIDSGFLIDPEGEKIGIYGRQGLEMIANVIEANANSCNPRFYGAIDILYREIFSFNYNCKEKNSYVPSSLQLYSTNMRDPAFYRLYKRIDDYLLRFKFHLQPYTVNELYFPGVKIENVYNDKMYTFFEKFDALINNAVTVENWTDATSFNIMARQYRLNQKPWTYRIDIRSDRHVKGLTKILIGPYYEHDGDEFSYVKEHFMDILLLDKFIVDLKPGMNTIERPSVDSLYTMVNMTTGDKFYKELLKAIEGNESFTFPERVSFPNNIFYPKGTSDGTKYKLFFLIFPFDETKMTAIDLPGVGYWPYDGKQMVYPFDRPLQSWFGELPNVYLKDFTIVHLKNEG